MTDRAHTCTCTCTCMHTLYLGQSVAEKPSTFFSHFHGVIAETNYEYLQCFVMARRAIPMIAFPRVRCMFIYMYIHVYIYLYVRVTYASMHCIRS